MFSQNPKPDRQGRPATSRGITVGMPVFDRMGRSIGVVGDVFGAIVRVDGLSQADVWLGLDVLARSPDGKQLTLEISLDEIARHRLSIGGADESDEPPSGSKPTVRRT